MKEFLRLKPKTEKPDPRVSILEGLEKYKIPVIALLKKRESLPLHIRTLLELYHHDESECEYAEN